jgi:hypothetical protein
MAREGVDFEFMRQPPSAHEKRSFRTSPASFAGKATPHPALIPQEVPEASGKPHESRNAESQKALLPP